MKTCLLLLFALFLCVEVCAAPDTCRVVVRTLNVRSGPAMDAAVLSSLSEGEQVVVGEFTSDGWARILRKNGSDAYVSAKYLVKADESVSDDCFDRFPMYNFSGGHVPLVPRNWLTTAILILSVALVFTVR